MMSGSISDEEYNDMLDWIYESNSKETSTPNLREGVSGRTAGFPINPAKVSWYVRLYNKIFGK